jgi:hypothetical protein
MTRRILAIACLAAAGLAAAAPAAAQSRVHRTPDPYATFSEDCSAAIDCEAELVGAPETQDEVVRARVTRRWAVRSSHAPADEWSTADIPIAVIADVDIDGESKRRWRRRYCDHYNRGVPFR